MSRPSDRKECCKPFRDSRFRTMGLSKDLNSLETKFGVSVDSSAFNTSCVPLSQDGSLRLSVASKWNRTFD